MKGRETAASLFRDYLKQIRDEGRLGDVRGRCSPETVALIDKPPFVLAWMSMARVDEIHQAYWEIEGRRGLRRLGKVVTQKSFGPLLKPLLKNTLAVFGSDPSAIFSRLGSIASPLLRGLEYDYEPEGPTEGRLTIRHVEAAPESTFVVWEGALEYVFEICQVEGTIAESVLLKDGRSGTMHVRWTPRG